jgi:6-phosphogluconolactonase (cycloisomerase 2 family)
VRLVRSPPILFALLVLAAVASPAVGGASAAGGGLRFVECLSAQRPERGEPQTARAGGCNLTPSASIEEEGTGIDYLSALTASPDGRSLYAVSGRDDSIAAFSARPLRMTQCLTTNAHLRRRGKRPCQLLPHSGTEDVDSGLNGVRFVAVSPDGRDVYTTSGDDSIATFARAPSGRLAFAGCITGDLTKFGSAANGSCQPIPGATQSLGGTFSGLGDPRGLAISPDGRFVYVALGAESGIATLARAADGSLQFVGCVRGTSFSSIQGAESPCALVAPEGADNPNYSGLASPTRLAISADGTSLYAVSPKGSAIAEFRLDPLTGTPTFSGCLAAANRGTGPDDPCRYVPQANGIGVDTAMDEMREIAIAPDGTGLYGISAYDDAVAGFARDPATGRLTFASCIAAENGRGKEFNLPDPCARRVPSTSPDAHGSGLTAPHGLAISGRNLFVASRGDSAVDRFRLTPGGGLRLAGCVTDGDGQASRCTRARGLGGKPQYFGHGFGDFDSVAAAGHDVYAGIGDAVTISRFSFP